MTPWGYGRSRRLILGGMTGGRAPAVSGWVRRVSGAAQPLESQKRSPALSRQRLRVRAPSLPPISIVGTSQFPAVFALRKAIALWDAVGIFLVKIFSKWSHRGRIK